MCSQPIPPLPAARYVTRSFGDFANLRLEHEVLPPPKPHEVRIKTRAVGMNFADCFALLGLYELAGNPPFTPGFEVSGVIEAVGSDVVDFSSGDRVWAICRFGCYATAMNIDSEYVRKLADDWTFAEGAAYPAQAFTAWYALCELGGMPCGVGGSAGPLTSERRAVLVHSAAGGGGSKLVRMVLEIGGVPVCTVGNEEKAKMLMECFGLKREQIVVRGVDDAAVGLESVVRERALGSHGGVDVVVDSVLGRYFAPGFALLNPGGRYIVMGSANMMPSGSISLWRLSGWCNLIRLAWKWVWRPRLDLVNAINQNKTVSAFNVGSLFAERKLLRKGFEALDGMNLGKPIVGMEFPFSEAVQALRYFQGGQSVGKVVLTLDEGWSA
eukprot:GFKZ01008746.1.p1 GENE.GFKZ01008746.1~~GFKZ01008746.1.p1  ORF type:complete len:392 (-),score=42.46 GFKZ01008746.1:630-1778(-)